MSTNHTLLVLWVCICALFAFTWIIDIDVHTSAIDIKDLKQDVSVLDKRITGNALMSDQAWNEAQKAVGIAEENERKIQEILKRMEGMPHDNAR